jgi:RNA polymerase sigma-70 factor (ECF subfamily)
MPDTLNFAEWMDRLRARDEAAARRVFREYAGRLIALAAQHLDPATRRRVDPEDVVQSAFRSFFARQAEGQWDLAEETNLWGMLATITVRRCGRQRALAHAGRRDVKREVGTANGDAAWHPTAPEPSPAEALALAETVDALLARFSDRERPIVAQLLQGDGVPAVSARLGCSERKVYRVQQHLREGLQRWLCEEC